MAYFVAIRPGVKQGPEKVEMVMLIDKFIGYAVRQGAKKYLNFDPADGCQLPQSVVPRSPLTLYIHIPFCEMLCNYCSFHRVVFREDLARAYFAALRKEIVLYKEAGYAFKALYIGGGTPTVLIDELVTTIELIKNSFSVTEISVETNPNHLDAEKLTRLKDAGVERLSVGVQSFDDGILRATDRYHKYGSGEQIIDKIRMARGIFKTLNIDMIFNIPSQTEAMLRRDLDIVLDLKVDQISYYPFMVSAYTQKDIERKMGVVQEGRGRKFYEIIAATLKSEYRTSTAWCFSRGQTLIDEYVVNYEEYAGLGSGAFGYLNGVVYANSFDIPEYIRRVEQGQFPVAAKRDCNFLSTVLYAFMMQFFDLAVDLKHLRKRYGLKAILCLLPAIAFLLLAGGIKMEGNGRLGTKNPYYGVIMMREFFTAVNNFRDYCRSRSNQSLCVEKLLDQPV